MSLEDYAIVIGISEYPSLRPPLPGAPHNLQGPDLDAHAMHAWLVDSDGGNVPEQNRLLVTSERIRRDLPDGAVMTQPNADDLSGCFGWLVQEFEQSNRLKLGRWLYVYSSGHGFCVGNCDGGVYAANANPSILRHFYVRSWFDWFYRNAYFEEFVLWMDACSDPIPIAAPSEAALPVREASGFENGRQFVAFSARHPLKSVERQMPDGNVRGAFTYALLKGLRGDAADQDTGRITSSSMQNYLDRTLERFLHQQDRQNPDISKKPAFEVIDDIDFGGTVQQSTSISIRIDPGLFGKQVVLFDAALQPIAETVASGDAWTLDLSDGFLQTGSRRRHRPAIRGGWGKRR